MIYDLWDRIKFAAEGAWLRILDARDEAAERPGLTIGVLAAVAGVLAIVVIALAASGDGDGNFVTVAEPPATPESISEAAPAAPLIADSQIVEEEDFTIALPSGWKRTKPPRGASFAARSGDGFAQTTLWVEESPNLDFQEFVDQSLGGLERLGENAQVTDVVDGETLETSIAELQADVPVSGGQPGPYRVTLRAAGDLRFYLATSVAAGAPPARLADAELLGTTFRPQVTTPGD